MRIAMSILVLMFLLTLGAVGAWIDTALEARQAPAGQAPATPAPEGPQVPQQVKRVLLERQGQINALEYAKAVIQKELDSLAVQLSRDMDALQKQAPPGYELRGDLTYAKKDK